MIKKFKESIKNILLFVGLIVILMGQAVNYGALQNRVSNNESYIIENKQATILFNSKIEKLTIQIERSNVLMTIYLKNKGILIK